RAVNIRVRAARGRERLAGGCPPSGGVAAWNVREGESDRAESGAGVAVRHASRFAHTGIPAGCRPTWCAGIHPQTTRPRHLCRLRAVKAGRGGNARVRVFIPLTLPSCDSIIQVVPMRISLLSTLLLVLLLATASAQQSDKDANTAEDESDQPILKVVVEEVNL